MLMNIPWTSQALSILHAILSRDFSSVEDRRQDLWTDKVDQISVIPSPEDSDTASLRLRAGSWRGKKSIERPWMDSVIQFDVACATE